MQSQNISKLNETYMRNQAIDTESTINLNIDRVSVSDSSNDLVLNFDIQTEKFHIELTIEEFLTVLDIYKKTTGSYPSELQNVTTMNMEGIISSDMSKITLPDLDAEFKLHEGYSSSSYEKAEYGKINKLNTELNKRQQFIKTEIEDVSAEAEDTFKFTTSLDYGKDLEFEYKISENTDTTESKSAKLIEEIGHGRIDFLESENVYVAYSETVPDLGYNCGSDTTGNWYIYSTDGYTKHQNTIQKRKILSPFIYIKNIFTLILNIDVYMPGRERKDLMDKSLKISVFTAIVHFSIMVNQHVLSESGYTALNSIFQKIGYIVFFVLIISVSTGIGIKVFTKPET